MSVDIRVDQAMLEERGGEERVFLIEEQQPPESSAPPKAASTPATRERVTGTQGDNSRTGVGQGGKTSAATGVDRSGGLLSAGMHKEALPEMLRLRDYLEK